MVSVSKVCSASLIFLALAATSKGDFYSWIGSSSDPNDPNNWSSSTPGSLPGLLDDIYINTNGGSFSTPILTASLSNSNATVADSIFDLGGNTYTAFNTFTAYGTATIQNGTLNAADLRFDGTADGATFDGVSITATNTYINNVNTATFSNSTGSLGTLSMSPGSAVSTLTFNNFSNLSAVDSTINGSTLSIDLSTVSFTRSDPSSAYTNSLRLAQSTANVNGDLNTDGLVVDGSTFFVGRTGNWVDTKPEVTAGTQTLNTVTNGSIEIQGTANLSGGLSLGQATFASTSDTNSLNINHGGSLTAKYIRNGQNFADGASNTTIVVDNGTLNLERLDFAGSTSTAANSASLTIKNGATANIDSLVISPQGSSPFDSSVVVDSATLNSSTYIGIAGAGAGTQPSLTVTNGTLNAAVLSITEGASFSSTNSNLTFGEIDLYGFNNTPNFTATGGSIDLKSATPATKNVRIGANSGNMTFNAVNLYSSNGSTLFFNPGSISTVATSSIKFNNTNFNASAAISVGGNAAGSSTLTLNNSNLILNDSVVGPFSRGTVTVGNGLQGKAFLNSSSINTWRFTAGSGSGSNAAVELHDSSITARASTFSTSLPGAINIGIGAGIAKLEMWNSALNGDIVYVGANGTLKGDGTINNNPLGSATATLINDGLIQPGHSPGTITVNGNLVNNGIIEMEVDLANPANYDHISVTGNMLFGGTLRLRAIGTGTFNPALKYNFFQAGSYTGLFSNFDIDPAFGITSSAFSFKDGYYGINPGANAVPEPGSMLALAVGAAAAVRRKRKVS